MLSSNRWREGNGFVLQRSSANNGHDETQYIDRYGSFLDASHSSVPMPEQQRRTSSQSPDSAKQLNNNGGNK
jgi:hypothetical protein